MNNTTCFFKLFTLVLVFSFSRIGAQSPGPVIVGPNSYAFYYSANTNYGLFFNSNAANYEFKDGTGSSLFVVNGNTGRVDANGILFANSNIRFGNNSDLLIDGDRYAFRYRLLPNFGLFFNATQGQYEFRDNNAAPTFAIKANSGDLVTTGAIQLGSSSGVAPGKIRWNGTDFQGHNGTAWVSLTSGGASSWTVTGNNQSSAVSGNVGIGVASPQSKLHVQGPAIMDGKVLVKTNSQITDESLTLKTDDQTWGFLHTNNDVSVGTWIYSDIDSNHLGAGQIGTFSDHRLDFITHNSPPLMTVHQSGNVGIGDVNPEQKLQVGSYSTPEDVFISVKTAGGNNFKAGVRLGHYADCCGWELVSDETTSSFKINYLNNASTAVHIDFLGRVGIGTVNPFEKLHVEGNARFNGSVSLENALFMQGWDVYSDQNHYVINETNVGARIRIDAGGYIGINTSTPTAALDVDGDLRVRNLQTNNTLENLVVADSNGRMYTRNVSSLSTGSSQWTSSGNNIYNSNSGNVGIGTSSFSTGEKLAVFQGSTRLGIYPGYLDATPNSSWTSLRHSNIRVGNNFAVAGTIATDQSISASGNITTSSSFKVGSDITIGNSSSRPFEIIKNCLNSGGALFYADFWACSNEFNFIEFRRGSTGMKFRVTQGGNVWADGKITSREVEVTLASFPDYVFRPDYNLMPLDKLDEFIKTNGHLPNMPKEEEVVEKGLGLGAMNVLLVEKVEELTLHLIEKEKQVKSLEARLERLEALISSPSK